MHYTVNHKARILELFDQAIDAGDTERAKTIMIRHRLSAEELDQWRHGVEFFGLRGLRALLLNDLRGTKCSAS